MEEAVARAVLRLVAGIFRPVGGIGELGVGQYGRNVLGKRCECCDERIGLAIAPERRQPAQLAADQEGIDAAGQGAEPGIMEHHAPQAPFRRT